MIASCTQQGQTSSSRQVCRDRSSADQGHGCTFVTWHVREQRLQRVPELLTYTGSSGIGPHGGGRRGGGGEGGVRLHVFVKMKVKIIFDRHTHDCFLGENGRKPFRPYPELVIITTCTVSLNQTHCSKWSENVTRGPSWALDDITDHHHQHVTHRTAFSHRNFEILLTFGKVKASVTSKKVQNGRSTGTMCEHRHDDL